VATPEASLPRSLRSVPSPSEDLVFPSLLWWARSARQRPASGTHHTCARRQRMLPRLVSGIRRRQPEPSEADSREFAGSQWINYASLARRLGLALIFFRRR
jgi:hypothetical protein